MAKKLTRYNLEYCFSHAIVDGAKYIGVMIQLPNSPEPEVIINPSQNFADKLNYYLDNYNENLELVHNPQIKIVGLTYGDSYEEIEAEFFEEY